MTTFHALGVLISQALSYSLFMFLMLSYLKYLVKLVFAILCHRLIVLVQVAQEWN